MNRQRHGGTKSRGTLVASLLLALAFVPNAWAEPVATANDSETIVVESFKPCSGNPLFCDDADRSDVELALTVPAFVQRFTAAKQGANRALSRVLSSATSLHVRMLGTNDDTSVISVRGNAPGSTTVVLDGIPLSRIAGSVTDIGQWSIGEWGDVKLYRSGAPDGLGGGSRGGLGGTLSLTSALGRGEQGERLSLQATAGSWGAAGLRAWWGDANEKIAWRLSGGVARSEGDFVYYDDNGTNLTQDDDSYETRHNNQHTRWDAAARVGSVNNNAPWIAGLRVSGRDEGLPGSMNMLTPTVSMTSLRGLVDAQKQWTKQTKVAKHMWGVGGFASVEEQEIYDPQHELLVRADLQQQRTASVGLYGQWSRQRAAFGVQSRVYAFRDDYLENHKGSTNPNEPQNQAAIEAARNTLGASLSASWQLSRLQVIPSMQIEPTWTSSSIDPITDVRSDARSDWYYSPRLALLASITDGLVAKANAGRYFRAPTVIELYGNRGAVIGNPDLRAEIGTLFDGGLVWAPTSKPGSAVDQIHVEGAMFVASPQDSIVWVSTSLALRPVNLGDATSRGAEMSAQARFFRRFIASVNYTANITAQRNTDPAYEDKPLPGRPAHLATAGLGALVWSGATTVSLGAQLQYVGVATLDGAGLLRIPARFTTNLDARIDLPGRLSLLCSVGNVFNDRKDSLALPNPPSPELSRIPRARMDITGYPLPGRSFFALVEWKR